MVDELHSQLDGEDGQKDLIHQFERITCGWILGDKFECPDSHHNGIDSDHPHNAELHRFGIDKLAAMIAYRLDAIAYLACGRNGTGFKMQHQFTIVDVVIRILLKMITVLLKVAVILVVVVGLSSRRQLCGCFRQNRFS